MFLHSLQLKVSQLQTLYSDDEEGPGRAWITVNSTVSRKECIPPLGDQHKGEVADGGTQDNSEEAEEYTNVPGQARELPIATAQAPPANCHKDKTHPIVTDPGDLCALRLVRFGFDGPGKR